jgi:hypothetical protein
MSHLKKTYKGRHISALTESHLHIDGKHVPVTHDQASGLYHSVYMPYKGYKSLSELAQEVINYHPNFKITRAKRSGKEQPPKKLPRPGSRTKKPT